jgi:superfamily II DNA or RNA helicase
MELRDYQEDAVTAAINAMRGGGSTLLVMATGLGKTIVFAEVVRRYMAQGTGRRALVLAHRHELIHQAADKMRRVVQCDVEIEMGDLRAREDFYNRSPVIVSSVQTQVAGRGITQRMHKFRPEQFGIVIIDEAHHAVGASYRKVLDHFSRGGCRVLGVTATPDRADEAALGTIFDSVAFEFGIREGILGGWLVPIMQRLVSVTSLDFSACRTTAGDLNGADLDGVMQFEETLHGMVYPTLEIAGDRRGIIFAASVAHAERVCEIINRHKAGSAVFVYANTPSDERRQLFAGFAEGRYQWLVNVGIATEGWDDAALDGRGVQVIAMMRPTKSRSLYCQMIGRGTRPLPRTVDGIALAEDRRSAIAASAKPSLTVLDFCGNAGRHRLVHVADALAGKDPDEMAGDIARRDMENAAHAQEVDALALLTRAEVQAAKDREAQTRRGLIVRAGYQSQEINPFSLIDLAPNREMQANGVPASEKQLAVLRRLKVGIPSFLTRREASRLIDAAVNTPSPAQAYTLAKHGLNPADFTRRTASAAIDAIKAGREVQS